MYVATNPGYSGAAKHQWNLLRYSYMFTNGKDITLP